jgi:vacuolar-type H+-ATPase subunit H
LGSFNTQKQVTSGDKEEENLESSTGVLKELAAREQALSSKVAAAKDIIAQANADAAKMTAEYRAKRETEEKSILDSTLSSAKSAAEGLRATAESKVADAVKHIVSKVLP